MKRVISLLFLTLILGVTQAAFAQGQDQMQLRVGQQKSVSNGKVRVRFISVTEDSRCPINVECIQAGNARVKVQVSVRGGESKTFELNTTGRDKADQADAYRIELVSLTPGRRANRKMRPGDYRATFSIVRLMR